MIRCLPLLVLLAGCAGAPKAGWEFKPVVLDLKDVIHEGPVDEFSARYRMQFVARNPNPVPVRIDTLRVRIEADGIDLGPHTLPKRYVILAGGDEVVRFPVIIQTQTTPGAYGAIDKKDARFRFVGRLSQTGFNPRTGKPSLVHRREFPVDFTGARTE